MLLRDSLLLLPLKYPGDVVEAQRVGGIPSTSVTYIYIYYVNTRFLWFEIVFCHTNGKYLKS